jgi:hypothetical protein
LGHSVDIVRAEGMEITVRRARLHFVAPGRRAHEGPHQGPLDFGPHKTR